MSGPGESKRRLSSPNSIEMPGLVPCHLQRPLPPPLVVEGSDFARPIRTSSNLPNVDTQPIGRPPFSVSSDISSQKFSATAAKLGRWTESILLCGFHGRVSELPRGVFGTIRTHESRLQRSPLSSKQTDCRELCSMPSPWMPLVCDPGLRPFLL